MSLERDQTPALNNTEEETYDSSFEINSWEDLQIDTNLLRGIFAYGFEKPSPIQRKAINPIIQKKDIIAQAQSGTGKIQTAGQLVATISTFLLGASASDASNNK